MCVHFCVHYKLITLSLILMSGVHKGRLFFGGQKKKNEHLSASVELLQCLLAKLSLQYTNVWLSFLIGLGTNSCLCLTLLPAVANEQFC